MRLKWRPIFIDQTPQATQRQKLAQLRRGQGERRAICVLRCVLWTSKTHGRAQWKGAAKMGNRRGEKETARSLTRVPISIIVAVAANMHSCQTSLNMDNCWAQPAIETFPIEAQIELSERRSLARSKCQFIGFTLIWIIMHDINIDDALGRRRVCALICD